ncbi:helix-turn-helix domain-containing protein [Butyrivibrio sp. AC2005]|uniref:helix-turn-helix domain-containing protein n=1 Tax=Butyrivibrio sp. AC2005 TaxID=1280672 RepID=UPI0004794538|nr:helix-turn-helix transcriptional regulator [Butyrivibrio sp. AC2005]
MIIYDKLWAYMKKNEVSQYKLLHSGISNSSLDRLKKNQPVSVDTINKLCIILGCQVEDIMEFVEE